MEREAELAELRKRMGKAVRRRDMVRYAELQAEYDRLKDEHLTASHAEMKVAMRARRAQERAERASEGPVRWRLPAGFGVSPLAAERARQPRPVAAAQIPSGGLRPWRVRHPATERLWRP